MKRSRALYMEAETWDKVENIVADSQERGEDVSRSRWIEAAIRLALADPSKLEITPTPEVSWPLVKLKRPEPPVPVRERDQRPTGEAIPEIPIAPRSQPAEGAVADSSSPAAPPGPARPPRARVPTMAEHLALNPQLAEPDLDSHMALNPPPVEPPPAPGWASPVEIRDLKAPPPTGDPVADFSTNPTLPPAAIEKLKDETGPNPIVVAAVTINYEKVGGKWVWVCPDSGITGVSTYVNDIRADAWEPLVNHYGHDNLTLEVRRKP